VPADKHVEVSSLLETGLRSYGMRVEKSADRVALYQAVVGAYLSTFQLLGAFGLILAVLGLSVVILRNVAERAGELALLRAVGFRFGDLAVTVVAETLFVLAAGLLIGVGAALASVLPNLALGGSIPWERLGILLAVTSAVGVLVAVGVTLPVARMPIIPALRKD
jgi:putative ABC transport system permease protein